MSPHPKYSKTSSVTDYRPCDKVPTTTLHITREGSCQREVLTLETHTPVTSTSTLTTTSRPHVWHMYTCLLSSAYTHYNTVDYTHYDTIDTIDYTFYDTIDYTLYDTVDTRDYTHYDTIDYTQGLCTPRILTQRSVCQAQTLSVSMTSLCPVSCVMSLVSYVCVCSTPQPPHDCWGFPSLPNTSFSENR